jgi:hypothetical protein
MSTKRNVVGKLRAKEACVIVVGARPIEWQKRIVRDNRTGKLADIDMHELPPVDEGDQGMSYAFKPNEEVSADHPAVLDAPGLFAPLDVPRGDW